MASPIDMDELAHTLGISKQSLELRMRRLIPKMGSMVNGTVMGQLDRAEAKLLGLPYLSAEQVCALMHELDMIKA